MIKWVERKQKDIATSLTPSFQAPGLITRLLKARNLWEQSDIQNFISPSLKDLTDPLKLSHMSEAIQRLKIAWEKEEPVCVYGDYDLDGSSGIALLVSGLKGLGFENVSHYQPSRFLEGYGIHKEALKIIADRGDKVVVSVDCGITAVEEAEEAKKLGLDLIITDHHLPHADGKIPEAYAVINPNKGDCPSGLGHLAGVGVGFYLIMALKRELGVSFDLKSLLDLFTVGTITDMVPLIKENRTLLKHGLKILAQTQRPGIQALMTSLDLLHKELDSEDVSFTLGPKLNALSRLEKGLRPLDILMCEDFNVAQNLSKEVLALNAERKKIQEDLQQKITEQLHHEELQKPAIVLAAQGHAGVVGLVATKVAQQTGKPTFIVAINSETLEGVGSARGLAQDCLPEALAAAHETLDRYGGHAQAAGFSMDSKNFDLFKTEILKHYENQKNESAMGAIGGAAGVTEQFYDCSAQISEFNENVMNWLTQLGPYGQSHPQPTFLIQNFEITRLQWLKEQHLKLQVREGRNSVDAIMFFAKDKLNKDEVSALEPGYHDKIQLYIEPTWNEWQGRKNLQFMIKDLVVMR